MSEQAVIADLYHDRSAYARRWKAAGGKVVGYFADDVPTALIEAAGFLPYRISGDPEGGQPPIMARGPEDIRADRLEFVNSWVHLIDRGRYDFVDHFIVSNSRKYILQLAERLRALVRPPSFHILDRALGRSSVAKAYNRGQIVRLRLVLEGWMEASISETALAEAISSYNRRAKTLRHLASLRETPVPCLSGLEALHCISLARWIHSRDFLPFIENWEGSGPRRGTRIFLTGSGQDQDVAYAAIEAHGATIVGESHNWGARLMERSIPDGDAFAAIADHYAEQADFIVPLSSSVATTKARCERSGAQAVVSLIHAHDDAPLWEMPSEQAAIGLPAITVAEMPYRIEEARLGLAMAALQERMPA